MILIHPWAARAASACLGLSHQERNREQTFPIRDNWQQGPCADTAIISFIFLFPIARCGIAIGGPPTAILWFEKAFKLVSLELRSARCKTEAIETWEKWRSGRWKSGQSQTWWMKGTRSFQLVSWPWEALACLITFLVWAWRSHL